MDNEEKELIGYYGSFDLEYSIYRQFNEAKDKWEYHYELNREKPRENYKMNMDLAGVVDFLTHPWSELKLKESKKEDGSTVYELVSIIYDNIMMKLISLDSFEDVVNIFAELVSDYIDELKEMKL